MASLTFSQLDEILKLLAELGVPSAGSPAKGAVARSAQVKVKGAEAYDPSTPVSQFFARVNWDGTAVEIEAPAVAGPAIMTEAVPGGIISPKELLALMGGSTVTAFFSRVDWEGKNAAAISLPLSPQEKPEQPANPVVAAVEAAAAAPPPAKEPEKNAKSMFGEFGWD